MAKKATKKKVSSRKTETPARADRATTSGNPEKETKSMSDMETMIEFSEDIGEATPPPPLPIGQYDAEIRNAEAKISTNSGKRYAAVTFVIDPSQFPADFEAAEDYPEGLYLIYRRVMLEDDRSSRARLRNFIEAIGAPTGKSIDLNDWVGCQARVQVKVSEWEGEPRNEIEHVSAVA